jgi:hypothetical protein
MAALCGERKPAFGMFMCFECELSTYDKDAIVCPWSNVAVCSKACYEKQKQYNDQKRCQGCRVDWDRKKKESPICVECMVKEAKRKAAKARAWLKPEEEKALREKLDHKFNSSLDLD